MSQTRKSDESWPDAVPILTEADIVWNYSTSDGRRDLAEWLEKTFAGDFPLNEPPTYREAYKTLCNVISLRLKKQVRVLNLFLEEAKKDKAPSKAWQAACWNEMLRQLGYTVAKHKTKDPGLA